MIALIDSGVGGVNVLAKCAKLFPYDYVLLVDNKHAPYGNKSKKQLLYITKKNIDFLIKSYKLDAIILACNTLSFTIFEKIKLMYNIPILKMEYSENEINKNKKNILFFATKNSIINNKKIINKNGWKTLYIKDLPLFIDNNLNKLNNVKKILKIKYQNVKKFNIKTIILGCTHFSLIKKQIKEIIPNVTFYEYDDNVVKKLKKILKPKSYRSFNILLTQKDYVKYVELKSTLYKLLRSR